MLKKAVVRNWGPKPKFIKWNRREIKVLAAKSELQFGNVQELANKIKMRVNEKKTQILCIHANKDSKITSYIRTDTGEINSTNKLKILGFYFDSTPTAVCHVTQVINKFYVKLWSLRFLKRSGMAASDLLKVYETVIRAGVEYASVVYNSLIPKYMSDRLELVQKQACRIIFGRGISYQSLLDDGRIESLADRRRSACLKFKA